MNKIFIRNDDDNDVCWELANSFFEALKEFNIEPVIVKEESGLQGQCFELKEVRGK